MHIVRSNPLQAYEFLVGHVAHLVPVDAGEVWRADVVAVRPIFKRTFHDVLFIERDGQVQLVGIERADGRSVDGLREDLVESQQEFIAFLREQSAWNRVANGGLEFEAEARVTCAFAAARQAELEVVVGYEADNGTYKTGVVADQSFWLENKLQVTFGEMFERRQSMASRSKPTLRVVEAGGEKVIRKTAHVKSIRGPKELAVNLTVRSDGVTLNVDRLDSHLIIMFVRQFLPQVMGSEGMTADVIEYLDVDSGCAVNKPAQSLSIEWSHMTFNAHIYTMAEKGPQGTHFVPRDAIYSLQIELAK